MPVGTLFAMTSDAIIKNDGIATWAGAHDASSGNGVDGTSTSKTQTSISTLFGGNYYLYRMGIPFNTSSIGNSTINSGSLGVNFVATKVFDTNPAVCITGFTPADFTSIGTNDFSAFNTTEYASRGTIGTLGTGVYTYFNLTDTTFINTNGTTGVGMRISGDVDNVAPTGDGNEVGMYMADSGTATSPILIVNYTPIVSSQTTQYRSLLGVGK